MLDITQQIQSCIEQRGTWSNTKSVETAKRIARTIGGQVSWDEEAGECWARVLEGRKVVTIVAVDIPLMIILEEKSGCAIVPAEFVVVNVPSMDQRVMSCDADTFGHAFGMRRLGSPAINLNEFSADELWFVTVL
jgi:hypothetical protein